MASFVVFASYEVVLEHRTWNQDGESWDLGGSVQGCAEDSSSLAGLAAPCKGCGTKSAHDIGGMQMSTWIERKIFSTADTDRQATLSLTHLRLSFRLTLLPQSLLCSIPGTLKTAQGLLGFLGCEWRISEETESPPCLLTPGAKQPCFDRVQ